MEHNMNIYSMLSNELITKKIIYAAVIVAHLMIALFCWLIDAHFYFVIPSLSVAILFFIAFTLLERKTKKANFLFLFNFYNLENKKKELRSNLKYLLLMTLLIYLILLFTSLVVSNLIHFDKNYPLLVLLGVLLAYGLFEYYRFTITEIMGLIAINKASNKHKALKEDMMLHVGLRYEDIENFLYNLNHSSCTDPEIYSFSNHQLTVSLQHNYVFTPKKVTIKAFKTYLKENDLSIESLTKEDLIILEMFSC